MDVHLDDVVPVPRFGAQDWESEAEFLPEIPDGIEGRSREIPADEAYRQSLVSDWIRKAADELPAFYGEVYRLWDVQGLSGEEASFRLGIDYSLVRVRLHRARRMIVAQVRH